MAAIIYPRAEREWDPGLPWELRNPGRVSGSSYSRIYFGYEVRVHMVKSYTDAAQDLTVAGQIYLDNKPFGKQMRGKTAVHVYRRAVTIINQDRRKDFGK